jgi:hypothetical protein
MSDKLQQAIQATRVGDKKNAQFLLTQAIQEDPNNPQSWYLLSLLVDDKEKKQAYLTKVIELEPEHAKAHEQLIAITEMTVPDIPEPEAIAEESELEAAPVVLSSDSSDLEAQDEGETLPEWMADDLPAVEEEIGELVVETEVVVEEEYIPDWLDGSIDDDWDGETVTAVDEIVSEEKVKPPEVKVKEKQKEAAVKEKYPAKTKKETSEKQLNYLLIGLVIIAFIVFILMAYMIFNMM